MPKHEEDKERSYLLSRRSARMWPVIAEEKDDLERKVCLFLYDILEIPSHIIDVIVIVSIEKMALLRRNKKMEEVLVLFSSFRPMQATSLRARGRLV